MAKRTGIAALTQFVKGACHILTTFRVAIDTVVSAAVSSGAITSGQASTLNAWLNGAQAACDILRAVSGY